MLMETIRSPRRSISFQMQDMDDVRFNSLIQNILAAKPYSEMSRHDEMVMLFDHLDFDGSGTEFAFGSI